MEPRNEASGSCDAFVEEVQDYPPVDGFPHWARNEPASALQPARSGWATGVARFLKYSAGPADLESYRRCDPVSPVTLVAAQAGNKRAADRGNTGAAEPGDLADRREPAPRDKELESGPGNLDKDPLPLPTAKGQ